MQAKDYRPAAGTCTLGLKCFGRKPLSDSHRCRSNVMVLGLSVRVCEIGRRMIQECQLNAKSLKVTSVELDVATVKCIGADNSVFYEKCRMSPDGAWSKLPAPDAQAAEMAADVAADAAQIIAAQSAQMQAAADTLLAGPAAIFARAPDANAVGLGGAVAAAAEDVPNPQGAVAMADAIAAPAANMPSAQVATPGQGGAALWQEQQGEMSPVPRAQQGKKRIFVEGTEVPFFEMDTEDDKRVCSRRRVLQPCLQIPCTCTASVFPSCVKGRRLAGAQ